MSSLTFNITKPKLTTYQEEILYSSKRFTITEAGTKTGKTFSHIFWLFQQAHDKEKVKPGHHYWWVAPVDKQAAIAYNRMAAKVKGKAGYKLYESKGDYKIVTPLQSIIEFKSAQNPDNLYGEDVYAAVFDEFTRAKKDAWNALRSTLTATEAPCKLIGNFKGIANWGHQLSLKAKEPDSEYEYFKITCWDAVRAGVLSEKEVIQAQKDLTEEVFLALYMAEESQEESQSISNDSIQDMFTNSHAETGAKYITADIAFEGADKFTVWVWDGWKIIDKVIFDKSPAPVVESTIKEVAEKYKVGRSNIAYDSDGLGNFLEGYLRGAKPVHNNSAPLKIKGQKMEFKNFKAQYHYEFAQKANEKAVWIACDVEEHKEEIIKDFQMIRNKNFGTGGKFELLSKKEIREYIGRSPDYSDGICLRGIFELKPSYSLNLQMS